MGDLITYDQFREYQRKKKYGCNRTKLQGLGFPNDHLVGPDEPDNDWLAQFINKEPQEEE